MHRLCLNQLSPAPFSPPLRARRRKPARRNEGTGGGSLETSPGMSGEADLQPREGPAARFGSPARSCLSKLEYILLGMGYHLGICYSTSLHLPWLLFQSPGFQSSSLLCVQNAKRRCRGPLWWLGRPRKRNRGGDYGDRQPPKLSRATSGLSTLHQREARLK